MIYDELRAEGEPVSRSRLCRWFGTARCSLYYRPCVYRTRAVASFGFPHGLTS